MMRVKKRKKSSRYRSHQFAGRGCKRRARGSGNRGGVGMAGTGKRADQKKTLVIKLYGNNYFGNDKTLKRGNVAPKPEPINLSDIELRLDSFVKDGIAKKNKDIYEINLKDYKILGEGVLKSKVKITAKAASKSAIEKIKKAGSELILSE